MLRNWKEWEKVQWRLYYIQVAAFSEIYVKGMLPSICSPYFFSFVKQQCLFCKSKGLDVKSQVVFELQLHYKEHCQSGLWRDFFFFLIEVYSAKYSSQAVEVSRSCSPGQALLLYLSHSWGLLKIAISKFEIITMPLCFLGLQHSEVYFRSVRFHCRSYILEAFGSRRARLL